MGYFHFPTGPMSPAPAPPVSVPPGCELASLLQRKSWFQDLGRDSCATLAVFKRPSPNSGHSRHRVQDRQAARPAPRHVSVM